jgi:signal transduction histidine kinase/PAS domain-containing protein
MNVAPYVILNLMPAAISAGLAIYAGQRRQVRAAAPFSLLMTAVVFWSVCHALSAASSTLEDVLFWAQVQYGGIVLVGPLWLLFALAYADGWSRTTLAQRLGLFAPAALAYVAVLTNGWHHLWWPAVALDAGRPFGSLSVVRGLLFWLHFVFSYGCVVLGFALFFRSALTTPAPYQRQAWLVAIGALFPLVGNLAHLLGLRTTAVDDPTPFLFAASGLVMGYAALRYQLLDLTPIAQREIFASLPDGVVVLDQRGVVAAINDLAPPLLATSPAAWIGRPFLAAVAGSPLEAGLAALLTPPAAPTACEIAYAGADGPRAIEIRLRPLYADGARAGSLLVLRDRTARTRIERALDQRLGELTALNRLARAANAALQTDDMVRAIIRELVGNLPSDRVTIGLLQPGDTQMRLVIDEPLGATPTLEGQAVTGNDFALLQGILRTRQAQVVNIFDPLLAGTSAQAIMRREGLQTVLIVPLYSQAEPLGAMFVSHVDERAITPEESRLFETVGELVAEAIVRTRLYDQAQEASRAKSAFLATVSHELRTPLTSIIGFTTMLERDTFGVLPERAYEPLAHMHRSSQKLLRLINDILDFSKIEAGRFTIDLYPVALPSVVETVASMMQPQIEERGLELKLEIDPDAPLVYANSERLEQVLTNLLANAIKFTERGSITVRTTCDDVYLRCRVADTGIGIAPEQQRVLFQEFQQIANDHTRRYRGTGLGLAISRRLIEMMGGALTIESALGAGATFHCDLPLAGETLREKAAPTGT